MELHCDKCGELIDQINDPDPARLFDDSPESEVLCQKCRALREENPEE
jgi:hypothetical protein